MIGGRRSHSCATCSPPAARPAPPQPWSHTPSTTLESVVADAKQHSSILQAEPGMSGHAGACGARQCWHAGAVRRAAGRARRPGHGPWRAGVPGAGSAARACPRQQRACPARVLRALQGLSAGRFQLAWVGHAAQERTTVTRGLQRRAACACAGCAGAGARPAARRLRRRLLRGLPHRAAPDRAGHGQHAPPAGGAPRCRSRSARTAGACSRATCPDLQRSGCKRRQCWRHRKASRA